MCSSLMPAQVFRSAAVGVEFIARAVTLAIESQQLDDMPKVVKVRLEGVRVGGDVEVREITEWICE